MKLSTKVLFPKIVRLVNSQFPEAKINLTELKRVQNSGGEIFYIARQGSLAGYLILNWKEGCWEVSFVGVAKAFRKQKIGTKLVRNALEWVENKGGFVFAYASIYNTASINMLIKAGFLVEFINTRWIHFRYEY